MGCGSSKKYDGPQYSKHGSSASRPLSPSLSNARFEEVDKFYEIRDKELDIAAIIEHYMPAEFPVVDVLTQTNIDMCRKSWLSICSKSAGQQNSLILIDLVDEFYHRLLLRGQKFRKIFADVRDRASILTKAMTFILTVNQLPKPVRNRKYTEIGRLHALLGISHWMFAMYMSTLLETICYIIQEKATRELTESWTRLCSFSLRMLLEHVITSSNIRQLECAMNYDTILEDELAFRQEEKNNNIILTRFKATEMSSKSEMHDSTSITKNE